MEVIVSEKKILVIDDEKLLVKSTVMVLGFLGYTGIEAIGGAEGLEKVISESPDLILLDIMMPGMDGWEVLKNLKEKELTKRIPVVIFTAKEYSDGISYAKSRGAEDYIAKPFEPNDLLDVIARNL